MLRQVEPCRHPRKPQTSKAMCVYDSAPTLQAHKDLAQCLRRPLDHDQPACWFADLPQSREAFQRHRPAANRNSSQQFAIDAAARPQPMSQWRHVRPRHLCSSCGSGTFRHYRHRSSARPRRHVRVDGWSDPHRPWSNHSVDVQPVEATTPHNDRGESQPRVVWGIRRSPLSASVLFGCGTFGRCGRNCHRARKRPDVLRPHRSRTTPKKPSHEVVHRHCSHARWSCEFSPPPEQTIHR